MVVASAFFWLVYVDLKDRAKPEPRIRLLQAFILGLVAGAIALGIFELATRLGLPPVDGADTATIAWICFGLIGPVEEGCKVLVALAIVFRWQEFDEPIDGFVYAAAIALGFGTLENLIHLPALDWPDRIAFALVLPLTHTLFAAVWGFGIAGALMLVRHPVGKVVMGVGSVVLAMELHGLYDFVLFATGARWASALIAAALWAFVIFHARKLAKHSLPALGPDADPERRET
jgi:protease PrsW